MSIRLVCAGLFILTVGWLAPGGLAGQGLIAGVGLAVQDTTLRSPGDSLTLAFEREVFAYPDYVRRNPFRSLLGGDEGPRYETLLLMGILYSPFAGESIALFAEGTRTITPATSNSPRTTEVELTGGTYRVKEGARIGNGNVTVRTIEAYQVNIEVEEYGLFDSRIMQLPRGTSGGGSQ